MKAYLCWLMVVVCCLGCSAAMGMDKPSPIPEGLQKEATATFAEGKLFYIWVAQSTVKVKDLKLMYAVNPDLKEEEARRWIKLTYRYARTGKMVPMTATDPGITSPWSGPGAPGVSFKGQTVASIYLIRESEFLIKVSDTPKPAYVTNKHPEKILPCSNTIAVNLIFE